MRSPMPATRQRLAELEQRVMQLESDLGTPGAAAAQVEALRASDAALQRVCSGITAQLNSHPVPLELVECVAEAEAAALAARAATLEARLSARAAEEQHAAALRGADDALAAANAALRAVSLPAQHGGGSALSPPPPGALPPAPGLPPRCGNPPQPPLLPPPRPQHATAAARAARSNQASVWAEINRTLDREIALLRGTVASREGAAAEPPAEGPPHSPRTDAAAAARGRSPPQPRCSPPRRRSPVAAAAAAGSHSPPRPMPGVRCADWVCGTAGTPPSCCPEAAAALTRLGTDARALAQRPDVAIYGRRLGDGAALALAAALCLPGCRIETADLGRCCISARGAAALGEALRHSGRRGATRPMRTLRLNGNGAVGDAGAVALVEPWPEELQVLELGDCGLSDIGVAAIASAVACAPGLRELHLFCNAMITDSGAAQLAAAVSHSDSRLNLVDLDGTRVSAAGRGWLRSAGVSRVL